MLSLLFTTCSDPGVVPRPLPYKNHNSLNKFDELGLPTHNSASSINTTSDSFMAKTNSSDASALKKTRYKKQIIDVKSDEDDDLESPLTTQNHDITNNFEESKSG